MKKEKSIKKSVRFGAGDEVSREEKEKVKSEGILANSVETKPSSLQVACLQLP